MLTVIMLRVAFSYCYSECHYDECRYAVSLCRVSFCSVVMLSVIMLNVVTLINVSSVISKKYKLCLPWLIILHRIAKVTAFSPSAVLQTLTVQIRLKFRKYLQLSEPRSIRKQCYCNPITIKRNGKTFLYSLIVVLDLWCLL